MVRQCPRSQKRDLGHPLLRRELHHNALPILAKNSPQSIRDLAYCRGAFHCFEDHRHQVAAFFCGGRDPIERCLPRGWIAAEAQGVQAFYLALLLRRVDSLDGDARLVVAGEFVHTDDDLFAALYGALERVGGVLDLALDPAAFDGAEHAAHLVDLFEVAVDFLLDA